MSLFVLFMIGALRLIPIDIIGDYNQLAVIAIYSIIISIIIYLLNDTTLKYEISFLNYYFFWYVIFLLFIGVYSFLKYGYSLDALIKNFYLPYLLPLGAYGLVFIFHHHKSLTPFLSLISIFVVVMLIFRMLSWGLYNYYSIVIFPRILFQYEEWVRDGFQRIETGMLFGVALSYVIAQSIKSTLKGSIYKLLLVFMLLFLIYVTRVRFQATLVFAIILVAFLFYKPQIKHSFIIKLIFLSLGGGFFLYDDQYLDKFLQLISTQGQYAASSSVRFDGISHYFSMMKDDSAYLGLGVLIPSFPKVEAMMARTQDSIYYLDDLGILGSVIQFGVFTAITHLILFMKSIQIVLKSRKVTDQRYFIFVLALTAYMIGSQLLLNMFDKQRIFEVPFYLAIYSYLGAKLSDATSMTDFDNR